MPQACTRMRTCPALGLGISRSTISKSAPGFGTCTTFIFAIETLRFLFWICPRLLMHLSRKPTHFSEVRRGKAMKNFERSKSKKFCNDFRSHAQAARLTRALLPRTMRPTITKQQTGIGRAHHNPRHLKVFCLPRSVRNADLERQKGCVLS